MLERAADSPRIEHLQAEQSAPLPFHGMDTINNLLYCGFANITKARVKLVHASTNAKTSLLGMSVQK